MNYLKKLKVFFTVLSITLLAFPSLTCADSVTLGSTQSFGIVATVETNASNQSVLFDISIDYDGGSFKVDWGDTNSDTYTDTSSSPTHTYSNAGTYSIKIVNTTMKVSFPTTTMEGNLDISFCSDANTSLIVKSFDNWAYDETLLASDNGIARITSYSNVFANCTNMIYKATDTPKLALDNDQAKSAYGMFRNTKEVGGNIIGLNFGSNAEGNLVTNVSNMFDNVKTISADLTNLNTANFTNIAYMFYRTNDFNQDISAWDVSNVTDTSYMFAQSKKFDKSLSNWNVSNVLTMNSMFSESVFNQDLSAWNISGLSNDDSMEDIFSKASMNLANTISTVTAWATYTKNNMIIDIGRVTTAYTDGNYTIQGNNYELNATTTVVDYTDFNYTTIAPIIQALDNNGWIVYENGIAFPKPDLRNESNISTIEDFTSFTTLIQTKVDIDDRNNTRKLTYSVTLDNNETLGYDFNTTTNILTFNPIPNAYGDATFTVIATDGYFSSSKEFSVNIKNIDDKPSFEKIANIDNLQEDVSAPISFDVNVTDIDSNVSYSASSYDDTIATVSIDANGRVTVTPTPNGSGTVRIEIVALSNAKKVKQTFDVTIKNTQDAPTINTTSLNNISIDEDSATQTFNLNVSDLDGDDLNVSVESNNTLILTLSEQWENKLTQADYNEQVLDFNISTVKDASGKVQITITVDDGQNTSSLTRDINVLSVYDPFTIDTVENKIYNYNFSDKNISLNVHDTDVVGDINYTLTYDSSKLRIQQNQALLQISSISGVTGISDVNITAKDSINSIVHVDFKIQILSDEDGTTSTETDGSQKISYPDDKQFFELSPDRKIIKLVTVDKETILETELNTTVSNLEDGSFVFNDGTTTLESQISRDAVTTSKVDSLGKNAKLTSKKTTTSTRHQRDETFLEILTSFISSKFSLNSRIREDGLSSSEITVNGLSSKSFTRENDAQTTIDEEGNIELLAKDAFIRTNIDGSMRSAILKSKTLLDETPFSPGSIMEIKTIDGKLLIKTRTTLTDNLKVQ